MKKVLFALSVVAMFVVSGCVVRTHRYHGHPGHARVVTIERGHVHSDHCGHYHHDGRWHLWEGHRHGPGCGHVHRGGRWEVDINVKIK